MWTKVKSKWLSILPSSLEEKIDYHMTSYRFGWRSSNKNHQLPTITIRYNQEVVLRIYEYASFLYMNERVVHDTDEFFKNFRKYFSASREERLVNDESFFRIFALLDKRTGKRTLKEFIDDYYECDDVELNRIYEIRFDNENIKCNKKTD